ncbi:MAG: YigZ family protein [Oscillospiraceae bacterium]|jgi:putative IMPACT (imprinted ancient) family translation regulator|nr:YigZ family protein [Oscillospiraceae bacterium]
MWVEYKIKRSIFRARLWTVTSEAEVPEILRAVKKEHRSASHWVYAYVLGDILRSNDNGEPPGTAGVPVLNELRAAKRANTLCVVVRWFGGTKLGKTGLADAYAEATKLALTN